MRTDGPTKKTQLALRRGANALKKHVVDNDDYSNEELWSRANRELVAIQMKSRKLRRIGHTLREKQDVIEKQALCWNP
jgi:hypothetical protein